MLSEKSFDPFFSNFSQYGHVVPLESLSVELAATPLILVIVLIQLYAFMK